MSQIAVLERRRLISQNQRSPLEGRTNKGLLEVRKPTQGLTWVGFILYPDMTKKPLPIKAGVLMASVSTPKAVR